MGNENLEEVKKEYAYDYLYLFLKNKITKTQAVYGIRNVFRKLEKGTPVFDILINGRKREKRSWEDTP